MEHPKSGMPDPDRLEAIAAKLERDGLRGMAEEVRGAAEMVGFYPPFRPGGWITLTPTDDGGRVAWIRCPTCGGISHLHGAEFPAKVSPSPSGRELRLNLACEEGHEFAIETEDHSGTMMLGVKI
jgi:hypothetical protein